MTANERRAAPVGAVEAPQPIRVLTLTTLFPSSLKPRHGIFVANRLRRMCDTGRIAATVIAAVPRFPFAYRDSAALPLAETVCGFEVRHPRYLHIPGAGMRMQPDSLARALLRELGRRGAAAADFDLVDAHYFYPDGVAAARVAEVLDLPLVISARGSDINLIGDIPSARRRMLHAAGRAQGLVAVSKALSTRMAALGMPIDRMHVLRNGVDTDLFSPSPQAAARSRLGLAGAGAWILAVGNLVAEKGFDLAIRAVASMPQAQLLIIGEGPLRAELQARARSLAPGRVEFRGSMPQSELRYAYAAADVLVLPSIREGWPNVLLECMACGTPVVAAAVGGVAEIVAQGAPGVTVAGREIAAWAGAIRAALDSPPTSEAVRRYASRFGWDEVVLRQCDLYEKIVREWRESARAVRRSGDFVSRTAG